MNTCVRTGALIVFSALGLSSSLAAQSSIITNRYDNARTASTLQETTLSTANVNSGQFGFLYDYPISGSLYAQPLYVAGLKFPDQSTHNTLLVATMNDQLYAFDADTNNPPLWKRDFTNPSAGVTAIPITDIVGSNSLNIVGNVGIEGTPALDPSTNTLYLVVRTEENGAFVARLHAVDITTGQDKPGSPVVIRASVNGTAPDAVNGVVTFSPKMQQQRAALVLVNGVVLVAWGSHEDYTPYHGWLMAYNASTLAQVGVFCSTPNGQKGGMWQSGRAPVIDPAGNVYFLVGNGDWDGVSNFSDSALRFSANTSGLTLLDWFTPADQAYENVNDVDLGSSGLTLLPGTNVLAGGGKEAILYLLDSQNLGHQTPSDSGPLQKVNVVGGIFNGPAYWNGSAGPLLYIWTNTGALTSYQFNSSSSTLSAFATGTIPSAGTPAGVLAISSNGTQPGTGIVWATVPSSGPDYHGLAAGTLRAFDAVSLQELWDSEMDPSRDRLGTLVKFNSPLVVKGRVYVGTCDGLLRVYGLLSSFNNPNFTVTNGTGPQTIAAGGTASYAATVTASGGFTGAVALSVSGLPSGATASFNPATITGGSGNSTLQISTTSSTPPGTYNLVITGTSGSVVNSAAAQLLVSSAAPATTLSVDFVGGGVAMASSETAGVVSKTNWNNATGAANSAGLSLLDENGAATGATLTWQSDDAWSTPITDAPGNFRLMKGYLDNGAGHPTTISVANLPVSATGYDIYVYTDGSNDGATRTGDYQISGAGITTTSISATDTANTDFSGAFTQANGTAGNYVKFSIATTAFTLTATPDSSSDGSLRAPVNGLQIVPSGSSGPNFSVSLAPPTSTVSPGATANYTFNVTAMNGFTGTVSLAATGLPSGVRATLTPKFVTGSGSGTLQIPTLSTTAPGTYTVTLTGTSGALTASATTQLVVAGSSAATAVSIDFNGTDTAMASTETAGVVAKANWNNASGAANSTGLALVDENGVNTGAKATWKADGTWSTLIPDTPGSFRMMKGYLDDQNGNPTVVTVSNLPVSASGYDVYVYTDGGNGGTTRSAAFQISGVGITTTSISATDSPNMDFAGSFVQANNGPGNYVKFTINATGFTLTANPVAASDGTLRAPLNGLEIVPSGTAASFTVSLGTASQSVVAGGSPANYTVNVAPQGGFSGTVGLGVSGLPSGATASFNPASIAGGSGSSTLQVSTTAATPAGTYTLTITGTSGGLTSSGTAQLVVSAAATPSFTVAVTTASQTVTAGGATTYPVTVTGVNGFSGSVTLSATGLPAGATAAFTPSSVTGSGSSTLQVSTAASTPTGTYTLTVTGTSGSLTSSATTQLVVTAPVAGAAPISVDFVGNGTAMATSESAGVVAKTNWNDAAGAANASGLSLVNSSGASTGAILTWHSDNNWASAITDTAGNYRMMRGYLDNGAGNPTTITVANLPVSASGYDVYVYAEGAKVAATRTGSYQLSGSGIPTTSVNLTYAANSSFSGTFTQAVNSTGNYVKFSIQATAFTLTATPGAASDGTPRAPVNGLQIIPSGGTTPSFAVSVGTASQTVSAGATATYPVTVTGMNGFSGTVTLSASGLPSGATAIFNPASVSGSGTSSLQVATTNTTPAGTYTLTVAGASGGTTQTATTKLVVTGTAPAAPAIGIDFVGTGSAMAAGESAGVIAKTNWNNAPGAASSSPLALKDASGNGTGATVTWQADNGWSTAITDTPGNYRLMRGYLDNGASNPTVITVANLPASSTGYDVYVYTDGANGANSRTGAYQISGTGIATSSVSATDSPNTDFAGSFTKANNGPGNYVVFTIQASGFTLTATPGSAGDGTPRAPVNGLQVIPH